MNYKEIAEQKIQFIQTRCVGKKAVIGLSGGLDSSVVATLAVRALGHERVIGFVLPDHEITPQGDVEDALNLANNFLHIKSFTHDLSAIRRLLVGKIIPNDKLIIGNTLARLRMTILYAKASEHNAIVLGTSDKSEYEIGFFTKHGDGAADIYPIVDLYKTEVRELAKHLQVPEGIVNKPSSPALWQGQTAEKEIGLSYEEIDAMLKGDKEISPELQARIDSTEHKRHV